MQTLLEVQNLSKDFTIHHLNKTFQAVDRVNFSVAEGYFLGIVGKSGSGKSTIIKCIYRSYLPESGAIFYNSPKLGIVDLANADERTMLYLRKYEIGYVSQFLSSMPRTTCYALVKNSLRETGIPEDEADQKATAALEHFALPRDLWDNYPNTLSGGEKLRLNIARAVVKEPRLLLLDEPTASLDHDSKCKVRSAIEKLKAQGTTMIGIFHDLEFMEGLCDGTFQL